MPPIRCPTAENLCSSYFIIHSSPAAILFLKRIFITNALYPTSQTVPTLQHQNPSTPRTFLRSVSSGLHLIKHLICHLGTIRNIFIFTPKPFNIRTTPEEEAIFDSDQTDTCPSCYSRLGPEYLSPWTSDTLIYWL